MFIPAKYLLLQCLHQDSICDWLLSNWVTVSNKWLTKQQKHLNIMQYNSITKNSLQEDTELLINIPFNKKGGFITGLLYWIA